MSSFFTPTKIIVFPFPSIRRLSSTATAGYHSDARREQPADIMFQGEQYVNRRNTPKLDAIAREKLQNMDYRSIQKIATALHIPARMGRDKLIDKIVTLQRQQHEQHQQNSQHAGRADSSSSGDNTGHNSNTGSMTRGVVNDELHRMLSPDDANNDNSNPTSNRDSDAIMSRYKDAIISQGFFNNLELHEIKFIAKKVNISESLSKRETVRIIREELKLTTEDILHILDSLPRRPRPRRKDSIFDEDMFNPDERDSNDHSGSSDSSEVDGSSSNKSESDGDSSGVYVKRKRGTTKVPVMIQEGITNGNMILKMKEDPSVKAFKQFLKMKKRQLKQDLYENEDDEIDDITAMMSASMTVDTDNSDRDNMDDMSKSHENIHKKKSTKKSTDSSSKRKKNTTSSSSENAGYHLQYSIQEAERFLTFLLETDIHSHSNDGDPVLKPSKEVLLVYHCVIDDALLLYDTLNAATAARANPTVDSTTVSTSESSNGDSQERNTTTTPYVHPNRILRLNRTPVPMSPSAAIVAASLAAAANHNKPHDGNSSHTTNDTGSTTSCPTISKREREQELVLKYPMNVVGDIAGHYHNLLHIFSESISGFPSSTNPYLFIGNLFSPPLKTTIAKSSAANIPFPELPINQAIIENSMTLSKQWIHNAFGTHITQVNGLKCLFSLLFLKLTSPNSIHILRSDETLVYLMTKIGKTMTKEGDENDRLLSELWIKIYKLYDKLPLASILDNSVFLAHGGLGIHTSRFDVKDIETYDNHDLLTKEFTLAGKSLLCIYVYRIIIVTSHICFFLSLCFRTS